MKRELGYIYREAQIILQRPEVWPTLHYTIKELGHPRKKYKENENQCHLA